jgi:DNA-binding MarR family transcriptional regulator
MSAGRRRTANEILTAREDVWPEAVNPVAQLMVRLFRLSNLVADNAMREIAAHKLSFVEFEVLVTLRGTVSPYQLAPTDLYNAILISSGGLTKVLYALQERKLITRGEVGHDRRSKPVRLTVRGRALAERVMADVLRADEELVRRGLSKAGLVQLTMLLRKLLATLEPDGGVA